MGTADRLPDEAYALALSLLPAMGPARLLACIRAWGAAGGWQQVQAATAGTAATVAAALGRDAHELQRTWALAAAGIEPAAVLARHQEAGVGLHVLGAAAYPAALAEDVEPPALLCSRGDPDHLRGPRVAIVGTRRCTRTGADIARELGYELAGAGVSVVSGLALGIDGAAHRGALAARGAPPVAVVGSGLDVVYPRHHAELWQRVADRGLLLSEAPLGARPEPWRFPARNRIIAGLSDLVVVVESHSAGGSMHTVDEADRRSIDVLAVPGSTRSPASSGTNDLLAEGRAPVRSVDDVLVALGLSGAPRSALPDGRPPPDGTGQAMLDAFEWQPATLEQLAERCRCSLGAASLAVARLVDAGWVATSGGWYERVASAAGVDR